MQQFHFSEICLAFGLSKIIQGEKHFLGKFVDGIIVY